MAVNFASSSSQFAEVALDSSWAAEAGVFTMNCWFNPAAIQANGWLMQIYGLNFGVFPNYLGLHVNANMGTIPPSSVDLTATAKFNFTSVLANASAAYVANQWQMATLTIGPSRNLRVYLDGGNVGVNLGTTGWAGTSRTHHAIGYDKSTTGGYFNGSIEDCTIMIGEMGPSDVQRMFDGKLKGIDSRLAHNVKHYVPLLDTTYIQPVRATTGAYTTSTSAPTTTRHFPLFEPRHIRIIQPQAATAQKIASIGGAVSKGASFKLAG